MVPSKFANCHHLYVPNIRSTIYESMHTQQVSTYAITVELETTCTYLSYQPIAALYCRIAAAICSLGRQVARNGKLMKHSQNGSTRINY